MTSEITWNPVLEEVSPGLCERLKKEKDFIVEKLNKIDNIKKKYIPVRLDKKLYRMGSFYIGDKTARERVVKRIEDDIKKKVGSNVRLAKTEDGVVLVDYEVLTKDGRKLTYELDREKDGAKVKVYKKDMENEKWIEDKSVEVDSDGNDIEEQAKEEVKFLCNKVLRSEFPELCEHIEDKKELISRAVKKRDDLEEHFVSVPFLKKLKKVGKYYVGNKSDVSARIFSINNSLKNVFGKDVGFSMTKDKDGIVFDEYNTLTEDMERVEYRDSEKLGFFTKEIKVLNKGVKEKEEQEDSPKDSFKDYLKETEFYNRGMDLVDRVKGSKAYNKFSSVVERVKDTNLYNKVANAAESILSSVKEEEPTRVWEIITGYTYTVDGELLSEIDYKKEEAAEITTFEESDSREKGTFEVEVA